MQGLWGRACGLAGMILGSLPAMAMDGGLARMSLRELGDVEVTSVSRTPEQLRGAPAAIYVISHDEIEHSGASTLVEALRLAPNLQISQLSANQFVAAARGFGGNPAVQNFSNKLLLLIDGRSVYSPLFSGISLDAQDVLLADIDRIEVISGPGATLWGANAVNGVINVITRPAWLTTGTLAQASVGPREQDASLRYGGRADEIAWRAYAKAFRRDSSLLDAGGEAGDAWRKAQAGFRMDLSQPDSLLTLQGDAYRGDVQRPGPGRQAMVGANLLGRWQRQYELGELQLQGYYDHARRGAQPSDVPSQIDTWDLDVQQGVNAAGHRLLLGAGVRVHRYRITNSATLLFEPPRRTLTQWNLFAQDTMSLSSRLSVTLGLKLEHNEYSGWEPQPDLRIAWQATPAAMLWASASSAVRSPTPFDAEVAEYVGTLRLIEGNPDFQSERVLAYELGYRGEPAANIALSVSGFFNVYDDLRTVEFGPSPTLFPLRWDNRMKGRTWGVTAWGKWQVTERWRLSPGLTLLRKDLQFKAGASELLGLAQAGNDPRAHALLTSSLDMGSGRTLDFTLRHVASLPDPALPAYTELSARFGWNLSRTWQLALTGSNLLHDSHVESPTPGQRIRRSVLAEARWSR
jgi:iron complex outermembrane receptor protein